MARQFCPTSPFGLVRAPIRQIRGCRNSQGKWQSGVQPLRQDNLKSECGHRGWDTVNTQGRKWSCNHIQEMGAS